MGKRQPVRGQEVKWCVCGEWFASERDERQHRRRNCPGPMIVAEVPILADKAGVRARLKHGKSKRRAHSASSTQENMK